MHTNSLATGLLTLDAAQTHHAQHVLRLTDGEAVELFDSAGRSAVGTVVISDGSFTIRTDTIREAATPTHTWRLAAAVPKGDRADWMVEKLSELGCQAFIPLIAERSVVTPKGTGKRDRWLRLATESAKQSRRRGVMRIEEPIALAALIATFARGQRGEESAAWFLDISDSATPIRELLLTPQPPKQLTLFIGPEGGWSPGEVDEMLDAGLAAVSLTDTILRIETAAIAAAACVAAIWRE